MNCLRTVVFGREISVGSLLLVKSPKNTQNLISAVIMLLFSKKWLRSLLICLILSQMRSLKNWLIVRLALESDQFWNQSLVYLLIFYFQIHTLNQTMFGTQLKEFSTLLLQLWTIWVNPHLSWNNFSLWELSLNTFC